MEVSLYMRLLGNCKEVCCRDRAAGTSACHSVVSIYRSWTHFHSGKMSSEWSTKR